MPFMKIDYDGGIGVEVVMVVLVPGMVLMVMLVVVKSEPVQCEAG